MRAPSKRQVAALTAACLIGLVLAAVLPAAADEDEEGESGERYERVAAVADPLVKRECGACHMAYPRPFLPADSWARIMESLGEHFGENAFLPEKTRFAIRDYYTGGSPETFAAAPAQRPLRITETRWWRGAHRGEVPPGAFQRKEVGARANCPACHKQAERGLFDE